MAFWIGERTVVASPGDTTIASRDGVVVYLDAGQAFGTGTHPTTRMCLLWLESHLAVGQRVLDVGTGSGILAIAAAKLGGSRVVALDRSLAACQVARRNVHLNQLDQRVGVVAGTPAALARGVQFDLVVANIDSAADVRYWLATLARLTRPGGRVILSGIRSSDEDGVLGALAGAELQLLTRGTEEGWTGLVLEPRAAHMT